MSDVEREATEEMLNEGVEALIRGLKKFPSNYTQVVSNIWEDMEAARTQAPASGEVEPVRLIDWTPEQPANEQIAYNHVLAETLFGKFEITWKGWKEDGAPTVDETPWGDYFGAYSTVDEAKAACEAEYARRLRQSGVQVVQATASGEVEPVAWASPLPDGTEQVTKEFPERIYGVVPKDYQWYVRPLVYADTHPPVKVPEDVVKALRTAMHHWMKDGVESADEEDATFCDSVLQELLTTPTTAATPAKVPENVKHAWTALRAYFRASIVDSFEATKTLENYLHGSTPETNRGDCCCGEAEEAWRMCPEHGPTPPQEQ